MTGKDEMEALYADRWGRLWDRVEAERPATYWERNLIDARRLARRQIAAWLDPLDREHVLDAGCGRGLLARYLAGRGARVAALDLLPRFAAEGASDRIESHLGDLREPVDAIDDLTTAVLSEVLGDYAPEERLGVFRGLAAWKVRRIVLVIRQSSPWGGLIDGLALPGGHAPVDTVRLFRGIHLESAYFLTRRETVRRRHVSLEIAEFSLSGHGGGV